MTPPLVSCQANPDARAANAFGAGWPGELEVHFADREGATFVAQRRHQGPLTLQRVLHPEGPRVCHAVVLHPPGGMVEGDALTLRVNVGSGAHALVTTPGAGKWYRGRAIARLTQVLTVEAGATLEFVPQENIVFDGAQAELATSVALDAGATYVGQEITALGRPGAGELFERGILSLSQRLAIAGRPALVERLRLAGGDPLLASAAGLGGATAMGTLVVASPRLAAVPRELERSIDTPGIRHGVTRLPQLLIARALGHRADLVRTHLASIWQALRPAITGLAPVVPRVWLT